MIYNDLLIWIKKLPYWQQVASSKIMKNDAFSKDDYDKIYAVFKSERGLSEEKLEKKEVVFPSCIKTHKDTKANYWKGIKETKGINALKDGESLEIERGLNLVYGENGSGKSGYTRLFNNAFSSKGDKNLLPNIYSLHPEEVYAKFIFQGDTEEVVLEYPLDKDNTLFQQVMVFDSESASRDMKNESELNFVPSEFRFFDELLHVCTEVQMRLDHEVQEKTKDNPFLVFFENENSIKTTVESLNERTSIKDLEKYILSEEEKKIAKEVTKEKAKLLALNIAEKNQKLKRIKTELLNTIDSIKIINDRFKQKTIDSLTDMVKDLQKAAILSKKEGVEQFENENIKNLGSDEWKAFLVAAQKYYKTITTDIDTCIFCGQSIKDIDVIGKYWTYLESVAEKNLQVLKNQISELDKEYVNMHIEQPGLGTLCGEWMANEFSTEYQEMGKWFEEIRKQKELIHASLEHYKWNDEICEVQIPQEIFNGMLAKIDSEIESLQEDEISKKISELEIKEREYTDRKKIVQLLPQIQGYVNDLKWIALAEKSKVKTRLITNQQKELFTKYVTDDYISLFEDECKILNADFNAEIVQRGSKGITLKKIAIKGEVPGKVLSEGEQRAISIANFLAEVNASPDNIAVVFDDPVSSLDHNRRHVIAKRLVDESKKRQVIIFTHDITFLMETKSICDKNSIENSLNTIRKISAQPGCISKVIPWQSMSVKERIKKLNVELQNLQKLEKSGEIDTYFYRAKEWCELLRESWERAIEEVLLNDAIQRYNPSVQTQRLAKAPFTTALYGEVEKGMSECSAWVHDRARALNGEIPDTSKLQEYLMTFSDFVKKNRPKS